MAKKKVGFGIIGCGTIADFHAHGISECAEAELVAVCDVDQDRADSFAQSQGLSTACGSPAEIARLEEVDAVCICTPSGYHLDSALTCIESGKHPLVEKPLEITTARIDQIIERAAAMNVKVGGIFQLRFSPDVQKAKKALEKEALGKILIVDAYIKYYRSSEYYASAGWRGTWEVDGGGALMNQSIHYIDLLLWLAGDVKSVTGCCRTLAREIEVEDTAHALVTYTSGAVGVIEGTTCAYPGLPSRIEIHGEKGSVCLEDGQITRWDILGKEVRVERTDSDEKGHADPKAISTRGHVLQIQDFVDAILKDRSPAVDATEARRSVAVIEAIYQSSQQNRPIDIATV